MKQTSEETVRLEASRGKNQPMAKSAKVIAHQNGEVRPTRRAAQEQTGTDESKNRRK